jgi:hypothetical protein
MEHDLRRLRQELDSPRLSALRSTLGLAVARAAIRSFGRATTGGAPSRLEETGGPRRRRSPGAG